MIAGITTQRSIKVVDLYMYFKKVMQTDTIK